MSQWLQDFLEGALREDLCTKIRCTTCGGLPFRKGLLAALGRQQGGGPLNSLGREGLVALSSALVTLEVPQVGAPWMEGAVRFLLFEVWTGLPGVNESLEKELERSWAGEILDSMKRHHEARVLARRSHEERNDPGQIATRRASVLKARLERLELRLIAKRERDQAWKSSQQAKEMT